MIQHQVKQNFKEEWSNEEINRVKKDINQFFERTADWDNSVNDMGPTYRVQDGYASLQVSEDFYLDEGIRISSFALTEEGKLILIGIQDEDEQQVYFEVGGY